MQYPHYLYHVLHEDSAIAGRSCVPVCSAMKLRMHLLHYYLHVQIITVLRHYIFHWLSTPRT